MMNKTMKEYMDEATSVSLFESCLDIKMTREVTLKKKKENLKKEI